MPGLREHAGLSKQVLWAGVGHVMELWSRANWESALAMTDEEASRWRTVIGEKLEL